MCTQDQIEQLRRWCVERELWIGPFDEVSESTAAALCDRSPETLRHWRGTDRRLACRKTKAGWRYALRDLAAFIDGDGENC